MVEPFALLGRELPTTSYVVCFVSVIVNTVRGGGQMTLCVYVCLCVCMCSYTKNGAMFMSSY